MVTPKTKTKKVIAKKTATKKPIKKKVVKKIVPKKTVKKAAAKPKAKPRGRPKKIKVVGEVVELDKTSEMTPAESFFKGSSEEHTVLNISGQPIVRKGGPLNSKQKEELISRLFKLAESGMALTATDSDIAKKIGSDMGINIHRKTIKTYLKDIVKYAPEEEIAQVQFRLEKTYKRLMLEASILLEKATTPAAKTSAINLMASLMERFTLFLESYGRKDKIADKQEILHELANSDLNVRDEAEEMLKQIK